MNLNIRITICCIIIGLFCLTGCSNKATEELETYKASMSTFYDNITFLDQQINQLDGSNQEDIPQLLEYLDSLDEQLVQLAALEVPEEFAIIDELADEASQNMTMAVSYFHQAYEGESFNQNYADAAFEYYSRSNLRLTYILKLLHGEKITDTNVIYTEDEEPSEN